LTIVNENVEHTVFGVGVITEMFDNKIWVNFQDSIGTKVFQFPEVFKKHLKVVDEAVEKGVLNELRIKEEQIELELKEREQEAAILAAENAILHPVKKKSAAKTKKK
jgi:hypothetical protein